DPNAPALPPTGLEQTTGLALAPTLYEGWLGLACPTVAAAVWLIRALVASNVLARREETTLYVPLNPTTDPAARRLTALLAELCAFAREHQVL
ncbi:MAG: hypothetical protein ACK527_06835, partial [Acidobacteriota bacterium]